MRKDQIQLAKNFPKAIGIALVVVGLLTGACKKNTDNSGASSNSSNLPESGIASGNGNDLPSGPHYDLNIIGVAHDKTADMTGANGHVIFVPLDGTAKILLTAGDFQVLDA